MTQDYQLRWASFEDYGESVRASGYVYGNPHFPEGYSITTSAIRSMTLSDSALTVQTRNSRYCCPLAELCTEDQTREELLSLLEQFLSGHMAELETLPFCDSPPPMPSNRELRAQNSAQRATTIAQQLRQFSQLPNSCYILCVDGKLMPDYFFAGFFQKEESGEITSVLTQPLVHLGMFQDSVLCLEYPDQGGDGGFDLRYFPQANGIRFYRPIWDMPHQEGENEPVYFLCNVGASTLFVGELPLEPMICRNVQSFTETAQET